MSRYDRIAERLVATNEIENFIQEWKSGEYKFVAYYMGQRRVGVHPHQFVELRPMVTKDEVNMRQMIIKPMRFGKTPDYAFITFVGTAGRIDTYALFKRELNEVFHR